tara:strand:+ start:114 stop:362 length:249 start_codon:yes stop_codon:yes gene_type:complete
MNAIEKELNRLEEAKQRNQVRFRLEQELNHACKEVKKDALYKMYKGEARTLFTFDYWVKSVPLSDLRIVLAQVREENNSTKF